MSVSGKCFKRRVFNMADENTERRTTLILRKIVRQWKTFTHAQYITIMYALDSTRQKFDD